MNDKTAANFAIEKLYLKELIFKSFNTPEVFKQDIKPIIDLNINNHINALEDSQYEVVLELNLVAKHYHQHLFEIKLKQAGIFTLYGFSTEKSSKALNSICLTILLPYAREKISSLVTKASFPALYLAPINFERLYDEHVNGEALKVSLC